MKNLRALLLLLFAGFLGACQPDATFRYEGAGADLYTADVTIRTARVYSYFSELCRKGLPRNQEDRCRGLDLTEPQWRSVVIEGFNDIDLRCNDYLNWLAAKQSEKVIANQTISAMTGVLGGVAAATGAAKEVGYAALALGFSANVYNAYYDTVLLGLGAPNVIALVDARRAKFRTAFHGSSFASLPDVEFALRSYLRICTPAAIVTDFSISAPSSASGQQNPIDTRVQEAPKSISTYVPTQATAPANTPRRRGDLPQVSSLDLVFTGGGKAGWKMENLVALQDAFCVPAKDRGKVNNRADDPTIATINLLTVRRADHRIDEKLDNDIMEATTPVNGGRCNVNRYHNLFENWNYRATPAAEKEILQKMAGLPLEKKDQVVGTVPTTFADNGGRSLIRAARKACGLGNNKPFDDQVTPDLMSLLNDPAKCGRKQ